MIIIIIFWDVEDSCYISGLLFENNKHAIAKVRENANRHGGKNATITKWRHWWQLLNENEKRTFKIQNIKAKCKNTEHSKTQLGMTYFKLAQIGSL